MTVTDPDASLAFLLAENVMGLNFRFLKDDGAGFGWLNEWDDTQGTLPRAVQVDLRLGDSRFSIS